MRHASAVRDFCMYLDRTYVVTKKLKCIHEVAMDVFEERRHLALTRLRRLVPLIGRLRLFLLRSYAEVYYRPEGQGAKRCREEFEAAVDGRLLNYTYEL